jgi:transcriptional regulator GlxA family with amidase domain
MMAERKAPGEPIRTEPTLPVEVDSCSDFVLDYVLSCPERELGRLTSRRVAAMLGMKRRCLARTFRRHTGIRLDCFIRRERLNRTCQILMNERAVNPQELAERLGYVHADHMNGVLFHFCT